MIMMMMMIKNQVKHNSFSHLIIKVFAFHSSLQLTVDDVKLDIALRLHLCNLILYNNNLDQQFYASRG